jgi:hypothetical protein
VAGYSIRPNRAGIREVLNYPQVRAEISRLAEEVGDNVRASAGDRKVDVEDYTTDRAASAVVIAHPAGLGMEAKHGTLTRAARSAGLPVKPRKE